MRNMDSRVIPTDNLSTDHRMVVATIRKETRGNRIGWTFQSQSVNFKKLMEPHINRKYQEDISYKLAQLPNILNSDEKEWIDFKDVIQGTPEHNMFCCSFVQPYYGGTKEVCRTAEKGHSLVERGDKKSYQIEKAIIQEVAERYHTKEQRAVSVS